MSAYLFALPPVTALAVQGESRRFPVRRVFCAGRNYADHIVEMGGAPDAAPPVFFEKPPSALVCGNADVPWPRATANLHHEAELVLALGRPLCAASEEEAAAAVFGLATGVDLTRRDLQAEAKRRGGPWTAAKAFDASAPISAIRPLQAPVQHLSGPVWLDVNDQRRQHGDLAQMLWQPPRLLAHLSSLFDLHPGDLVFTGTPAGVGPLQRGDHVAAGAAGAPALHFRIV